MIEDEVEVIEFNGASGVSGTSEGIMSRIKNFLLKGYRVNLIVSKGAVKQGESLKTQSNQKPQISTNINSRQESFAEGYEGSIQPSSELKGIGGKGPSILCSQLVRAASYQQIPSPESEMQTVIERAEKPVVEKKVERTIKEQLEKVRENLGQGRDLKESIASLLELEVQIDAKINEKGAGKLAYNESCLLGVQCLCYQSELYHRVGDLKKAVKCLEKCKKKFKIHDPDTKAKILVGLAELRFEMKQFNRSIDLLGRALKVYEKVKWKVEIAQVLQKIAVIYSLYDRNEDAKTIAYRALEMLKSHLPADDIRIGECYHQLGVVTFQNKEHDIACQHFQKALEVKKQHPAEKVSTAMTLNFLGIIQHQEGSHKQAIHTFSEALELLGFDKQIVCGQIWNNIALAFLEEGDFLNSKKAFDEALAIFTHFHDEGHPMIHRTLRNKIMIKTFSMQIKS